MRYRTKRELSIGEMNHDIGEYDTYLLTDKGTLVAIPLMTTDDYNHSLMQLHHYIRRNQYNNNKEWYEERGIKQKLILMRTQVHEQVHLQAVKNLSDDDFLYKYGISRWDLLFNKRYSKY